MTQPLAAHAAAGADAAPDADADETWELRLYVTDRSPNCVRAIENLRRVCEEHLAGRYQIEVVDLLENPRLAADDQILAVPTVVRKLPLPIRTIVGDLSDTDRVLVGLPARAAQERRDMTDTAAAEGWALTLYINGASAKSIEAIETVRRFCDEELRGQVDLEIIDVQQQPALVLRDQIVAAPTLIKRLPGPLRRITGGDLSDSARLRLGLDLGPVGASGAHPHRDD